MKIFVFGNPRVKNDSLPLRILPKLRKRFPKIRFEVCDPTEINESSTKELWILDSATGISDVTIFNDISTFQISSRMSVHDYDLALELRLLQKLGKIGKVKIIAVPVGMKEEKVLKKVTSLLL